jgi:hypothetical protein
LTTLEPKRFLELHPKPAVDDNSPSQQQRPSSYGHVPSVQSFTPYFASSAAQHQGQGAFHPAHHLNDASQNKQQNSYDTCP